MFSGGTQLESSCVSRALLRKLPRRDWNWASAGLTGDLPAWCIQVCISALSDSSVQCY